MRGIHAAIPSGSKTGHDDPLLGLERLWNVDKHRTLNATPIYVQPPQWRSLFHVEPDIAPVEFRWIIDSGRELGECAKLARIQFPTDRPRQEVIMQGKLPVQVAIGDGTGDEMRIQDMLTLVRDINAGAKRRFPA
jgi:hypothetical protein